METITTIAAPPITYAEYKKLSLADSRARYPYYYVGLPIFSIFILIVVLPLLAYDGTASVEWEITGFLFLPLGITIIVWLGT